MEIIASREALFAALLEATRDREPSEIRAEMKDRRSRVFFLSRLHRRYEAAHSAAKKFGYVGVGRFVFAEHRMVKFQQRLRNRHK